MHLSLLIVISLSLVTRICTLRVLLFVSSCRSYFFFFKQKTAYEMRISDWSSDVCSSDLRAACTVRHRSRELRLRQGDACGRSLHLRQRRLALAGPGPIAELSRRARQLDEIGRAHV